VPTNWHVDVVTGTHVSGCMNDSSSGMGAMAGFRPTLARIAHGWRTYTSWSIRNVAIVEHRFSDKVSILELQKEVYSRGNLVRSHSRSLYQKGLAFGQVYVLRE
jgi:hypothetical protein